MKKIIGGIVWDSCLIIMGACLLIVACGPREGAVVVRHIWSAIGQQKFVDFYTTNETYSTVIWTTNFTTNGWVYYGTVVTQRWDGRKVD